jgi:hypothetical protein
MKSVAWSVSKIHRHSHFKNSFDKGSFTKEKRRKLWILKYLSSGKDPTRSLKPWRCQVLKYVFTYSSKENKLVNYRQFFDYSESSILMPKGPRKRNETILQKARLGGQWKAAKYWGLTEAWARSTCICVLGFPVYLKVQVVLWADPLKPPKGCTELILNRNGPYDLW